MKNKKRNGFINFGNSLHRESSIKDTWNKGNLMVFTTLPVLYLFTTTLEGTCCRAWQLPIGTQTSKRNNYPTEQKNSAWQSYIQTVSYKLLDVFNECLFGSTLPERWKHYLVMPICKPNKKPDRPENFRPIILSSCYLKTLQVIAKNRIEWIIGCTIRNVDRIF